MRNIPHIIKRTILDKPNLWSRRYSGFLHLIEVLIIIIGTCFISCQANIIAHTQVASAKLEAQPHFLIHQSLEPNSDGDENANSIVKVINHNGLFYNLNIDEVCILNLIQNEKIAKQFLLDGFYYAHLVGTDEDGNISTFYCEKITRNTWMSIGTRCAVLSMKTRMSIYSNTLGLAMRMYTASHTHYTFQ